jgi:PAS domain S-box-containing protein
MAGMISMPRPGRFTAILAAIAVTTIAVMTVLLLWQLRVQELRHAEGETVALSNIIAEQTVRSLQSIDLALDVALDRLAEAETLGVSFNEFPVHAMLRSRVDGMPQLRSMFITDAEGNIVSSALGHPAPKFSVKDRDYFTSVRDRPELDRFVSKPATNRVDGKRTFFFSRRIQNKNGEFFGVIAASLDIAYVESLYDSIKLDSVSPITLYLDDGTLIARAPHDESQIEGKSWLPVMERGSNEQARFKTVRAEGEDAGITTYRRIGGFPMVLGVGNLDREALETWRDTARVIVIGAVANMVLVIAAAILLLRKQRHEEELAIVAQESSNQLRAMVSSAMDAIVTIDGDQRVVVFNPAAQRMFGYSEAQIRGKPLDLLLPERFRVVHEGNIAAFRNSGVNARVKDARMDIIGLRADGTEFPIESTIAQVMIDGKTMFTAILRDIGDRRRAEDDLRESHRQLRELASSLQVVREEERTSIARELHDELGQQLLRLRMDLSWLSGRIKELPPAVQEKVAEMKQFIAGTVDTLRRVTTRLRPPLLDELGLAEAARWQLDGFAKQTGITIVSSISIDSPLLDERTSINVFRILQESLTNVARHSEATQVNVSLSAADDTLALEISDNGHGTEFGDKVELGHGLVGIRERVLLLGGRMEIVTALGAGFSISIRVPLDAHEPAGVPK